MRNLILIIVATIALLAGGFFLFQKSESPANINDTAVAEVVETQKETAEIKNAQTNKPVDIFFYEEDSEQFSIEHATSERYIGSLDAPVVFYDFSSLSCPHCATFHTDILPLIKRDFIETGLVRMVFKPMPLNEPALMGEQLARCIPKKDYYKTISLLYKNQKIWAFTQNPRASLIDLVKIGGITSEKANECLNSKALEDLLYEATQKNSAKYNISSTPTFVFGDDYRQIKGVETYEYFSELLTHLVEKAQKKQTKN